MELELELKQFGGGMKDRISHFGPEEPTYIRSLIFGLWKMSFGVFCLGQLRYLDTDI